MQRAPAATKAVATAAGWRQAAARTAAQGLRAPIRGKQTYAGPPKSGRDVAR